MLEELMQGTQPQPEPEPQTEPAPELTNTQMLDELMALQGGAPSAREDAPQMDETQAMLLDNQFRIEQEMAFNRMQQEGKDELQDATNQQIFNIAKAVHENDFIGIIRAVKAAVKTEQEVATKEEEQKTLTIEGGTSGEGNTNQNTSSLESLLNAFGV